MDESTFFNVKKCFHVFQQTPSRCEDISIVQMFLKYTDICPAHAAVLFQISVSAGHTFVLLFVSDPSPYFAAWSYFFIFRAEGDREF